MSWLVAPFAIVAVYGLVAQLRDFLASPKIPHPAAASRGPSRLASWTAGQITAVEFERPAA